jgi:hypothetical protein
MPLVLSTNEFIIQVTCRKRSQQVLSLTVKIEVIREHGINNLITLCLS